MNLNIIWNYLISMQCDLFPCNKGDALVDSWFFTSCSSGRGNIFGSICLCVWVYGGTLIRNLKRDGQKVAQFVRWSDCQDGHIFVECTFWDMNFFLLLLVKSRQTTDRQSPTVSLILRSPNILGQIILQKLCDFWCETPHHPVSHHEIDGGLPTQCDSIVTISHQLVSHQLQQVANVFFLLLRNWKGNTKMTFFHAPIFHLLANGECFLSSFLWGRRGRPLLTGGWVGVEIVKNWFFQRIQRSSGLLIQLESPVNNPRNWDTKYNAYTFF